MARGATRPPPKPPIKHRPPTPGVTPRSRPEGIRWVRSDGTPNWSQRMREIKGTVADYATRPAETIHKASIVLEAAEKIAERRIRGLIVVDGAGRLEGVLSATDLVNYLGGGEYYSIVVTRHKGSLYSSLRKERVSSIASEAALYSLLSNSIEDLIKDMVVTGIGLVPVVDDDMTIYGVITERNIVESIAGKPTGRTIEEVMTGTIVSVDPEDTIREAAQTMVKYGFRRLPVISRATGEIMGMVTAKDYVAFFGSHEAFKYSKSGNLEEVLETPVSLIASKDYYTVSKELDVGTAALLMKEKGVDNLIIVEDGEAIGIVTERDLLISIALEEV